MKTCRVVYRGSSTAMSDPNGFEDLLEDYQKAYSERRKDLMHNIKKRNIVSLHLGGIVIECFIKYLIVKKFTIKKVRTHGKLWYTEKDYNYLIGLRSTTRDQKDLSNQIKQKALHNPSHNLTEAIKDYLGEIDVVMPQDIRAKLYRIEDPLNKSVADKRQESYIALRYYGEDQFGQDVYESWLKDFNELLKWLDNNTSLIRVV